MNKLRLLPVRLTKLLISSLYRMFSLFFKVNNKKVTFASYRSEELNGNLFYIHQKLVKKHPDINTHFLFKKFRSTGLGKLDYLLHMVKACYHLATSRYFIIDDYYFPVYAIKPRKGAEVIQLWHAAGAFKKFGLSTVGTPFGPSQDYLEVIKVHSNYSWAFASASGIIPYYAEAFGMENERILPLGVPRTDYFFQEEAAAAVRERFFHTFPELAGRRLILYAPTFRGKSHYQEAFHFPMDFERMKDELGPEYALLVHLHPYMDANVHLGAEGFLYHIKKNFDINELMLVSDILLTDYSSVIFDYSLLQRPIAFIASDVEEYTAERDFYYPYESFIPGPLFTEDGPLIDWILEETFDIEKVTEFRDRFFDYRDGRASERIIDHLFREQFTKTGAHHE
ncbi:CDP-glycerol glycerophosphotransferase family protein [Peribacillus sp. SCS-26]|uniref:CDP-glycerol glycerophosphotransferase family protein n=1 Tax=Paraperibacillus marinus TaxID=3115295 RepID=UPI003906A429